MSVTVIVPTTCESAREHSLLRAVHSVIPQLTGDGCVLLVVNGSRVDESVLRAVQELPRICVVRLDEGNVAHAQRLGRASVRTPFFCFLDDDDQYLPGALETRTRVLQDDASIDVVATNGYTETPDGEQPLVAHPKEVQADPLRALAEVNWLCSCAGMFRTSRVPETFFDGRTRYLEWTLIAYKIASTRSVRFLDAFTYRIHSSERSASKSTAYRAAVPLVLDAIASLDLPADVRRMVRAKIGRLEHALSVHCLEQGDRLGALRHHWRSLSAPGGLRYVWYSRRLLRDRAVRGSRAQTFTPRR
jgi:hypothetical protein